MINLGIIAEYNPFHNGHKYHYDELYKQLKPDLTMCVMSGNFVQRGEPAIFDKWTRAKLALSSGIDVVLELPVTFALGSAERFAFGAVSILNDLGATHLAFGVEDSVEELSELLDRYLRFEFNIKEHIKNNDNSYIKARNEILENSELLRKPNNILAFEYLKALRKLRSSIIPIGIKRKAVDHDSDKTVGEFASASAIRKLIVEGNSYDQFVPYKTETKPFLVKNDFSKLINFKIMTMGPERIGKIQGVREGLEFKFYKNGFLDLSAEELIMAVKSKRYTYTAISRMLFCILLGIEKTSYDDKPEYTRLLGISVNYSRKFKSIAKNFKIPVITNAAAVYRTNDEAVLQAEQDYLASDIYFSLLKREEKGRVDFTTLPHIHWS